MCADSGDERDGCSARHEWMMEEAISTVVNESLWNKFPEVSNQESMLAYGDRRPRTRRRVHNGLGCGRESEMVEGVQQEVEEEDDEVIRRCPT